MVDTDQHNQILNNPVAFFIVNEHACLAFFPSWISCRPTGLMGFLEGKEELYYRSKEAG